MTATATTPVRLTEDYIRLEMAATALLQTARELRAADLEVEDAEAALHACRIAASVAAGNAHAASTRLRRIIAAAS